MPDLYIDVDTAIAVAVNVAPLTDNTDFISAEESIAYNAAGMDLNWNFITSAGVQTQTNVVPTTAGVHDWTHVGNAMYKLEIPASGGTINNDTEGTGWFSGYITGVLNFIGPRMTFRAAAVNDALIDGGETLDVNSSEIGGASSAGAIRSAVGLSSANLDTQLNSISASIALILEDTGTTLDAKIDAIITVIGTAGAGLTDLGGMSTAMKAEVNTELVDVMETDTHAEITSPPAAVSSFKDRQGWMFALSRNKLYQTTTGGTLRNDADGADIGTFTASDDGTGTRGKWA